MKTSIFLPLALATFTIASPAPQTSTASSSPLGSLGPLIGSLSSGCTAAIGGFVLNPTSALATCLSLGDALSTFTQAGSDSSLVPSFNTYLSTDICGKPACSGQALSDANTTLNNGCNAQDKASNGGVNGASLFQELLDNYYTLRNSACYANSATNTNCVVESMYAVQNATGKPLSLSTLTGLLGSSSSSQSLIQSLEQNKTLLCSDCNKAILSAALKGSNISTSQVQQAGQSSGMTGSLVQSTTQTCGQSFLDGSIPSTVKNASVTSSGSNASGSSGSSAASVISAPIAASGLLGLFGAGLALLA